MARCAQTSDSLSFVSAVSVASSSVVLISDSLTLSYLSVGWSPLCWREGEGKGGRGEGREEGEGKGGGRGERGEGEGKGGRERGKGGGEEEERGEEVALFFFIIIHTGNSITTNYYTSDVISKIRSHVTVTITCTFSITSYHIQVTRQLQTFSYLTLSLCL